MIQNWIQQGSENWTFYNIPLYLRVHGVWGAMKQFWAILARVVEPEYVPDTDPNNGRWVVTWAARISWVGW